MKAVKQGTKVSRNTRSANADNSASSTTKNPRDAGKALAVKMLRELERASVKRKDSCFVDPAERKPAGTPQWNVVLEYLDAAGNNRATLEGFACILSDYVASCASGCIPDADTYAGGNHA